MRHTKVPLHLIIVVILALGLWPSPALAQPTCRFVLGFAALRDLVGAQKVGTCLEDEHFNLENGNAEQRTSGGLLVWRKADNFTAFTDGGTSWVNGPNGLQSRPNSTRFSWEKDPVQSTVPLPAAPQPQPARPAIAAPVAQPAPVAAVPTVAPTATPRAAPDRRVEEPASKLTPTLAARCQNLAQDSASEGANSLSAGDGHLVGELAHAMNDLCRSTVVRYGEPGFICFEGAERELRRSRGQLATGSGGSASAAFLAQVDLCTSSLDP